MFAIDFDVSDDFNMILICLLVRGVVQVWYNDSIVNFVPEMGYMVRLSELGICFGFPRPLWAGER
jgi:hypothetical protein